MLKLLKHLSTETARGCFGQEAASQLMPDCCDVFVLAHHCADGRVDVGHPTVVHIPMPKLLEAAHVRVPILCAQRFQV